MIDDRPQYVRDLDKHLERQLEILNTRVELLSANQRNLRDALTEAAREQRIYSVTATGLLNDTPITASDLAELLEQLAKTLLP